MTACVCNACAGEEETGESLELIRQLARFDDKP